MEKLYYNKSYRVFLVRDINNPFSNIYTEYPNKNNNYTYKSIELEVMPLKVKELLRILYK